MSDQPVNMHAPRLPSLTGLRFPAALAVVLTHGGEQFLPGGTAVSVMSEGRLGVDLFFLLSGFVLTWSLRSHQSARRFYWNRFARVYPLHLVCLIFALGVFGWSTWLPLISETLLVQGWTIGTPWWGALNFPSWSLSCEAFFYLCFPFLASRMVTPRHAVVAVALSAGVLLAVPAIIHFFPPLWPWLVDITMRFPPYRMAQFVIGMAAAVLVRSGWRCPVPAVASGFVVVAIAVWIGATGASTIPLWQAQIAVTGPMFLLLARLAARDVTGSSSVLARPVLVRFGEQSFALYLIHVPLLRLTSEMAPDVTGLTEGPFLLAGFVALALLFAAGAHRFLEAPVEAWLRARPGFREPLTSSRRS